MQEATGSQEYPHVQENTRVCASNQPAFIYDETESVWHYTQVIGLWYNPAWEYICLEILEILLYNYKNSSVQRQRI